MAVSVSSPRPSGTHKPVAVAVLYENPDHLHNLEAAIADADARFAGGLKFSELRPGAVEALRADTLLVSLEPMLDRNPGVFEQVLSERSNRWLVFNDAAASRDLKGADRKRWLRHLGEKILGSQGEAGAQGGTQSSGRLPVPEDPAEIWLLGASIGGPEAVRAFLSEIDPNCPAALVLAQHIGGDFVQTMADQLNQVSALPVILATPGHTLAPGQVLVTPVNQQMSFDADGSVVLSDFTEAPRYSPCIDDVIAALLTRYGQRVNVIIFSGMASDGVAGAAAVRESGGELWVQNPESCVVSSMVDGARKDGPVRHSAPPSQLAEKLNLHLARLTQT